MPHKNQITRRAAATALTGGALAGLACAIDQRQPAPNWFARTITGEKLTSEALRGKPVLLQFWTTWCPYCRREQEAVEVLTREFDKRGLVVVAVNVAEPRKKVKQYLEGSPRSCKVVLTEDTNLVAIFGAKSFPVYVLIDANGLIAGRQNGAGGERALRELLRKVQLA